MNNAITMKMMVNFNVFRVLILPGVSIMMYEPAGDSI